MTEDHTTQTRGERMLALRRARMAASPPILRGGFRPFFFGGALWAVVALFIWLVAFLAGLELSSGFDPLQWHRHEMLFGFIGAVITGFLLTAIPNWTGRLPIAGAPLAALFGLWLAGRIAVLFSSGIDVIAAVVDVGFYLALAFVAGREVFAAKNRNMPIVGLVLLFALANAADHAGAMGLLADSEAGYRAGIALVVLLISLIGGRIVPSFTRNWMMKAGIEKGLPGQPTRYDMATIGATALALISWLLFPSTMFTGAALLFAGLLQLVRVSRWGGWRTLRDPLVSILHLGYLWLPTGLLLLGWSVLDGGIPRTAAIHALTAGAMATMILAVMTRATLGHTGRALKAGPATIVIYALITVAALLRVAAPLDLIGYRAGIEAAGAAWAAAFLLFLATYGPLMFRARPGEEAN